MIILGKGPWGLFSHLTKGGSSLAYKINERCINCMLCEQVCPVHAIHMENRTHVIDKETCISCAACAKVCNFDAAVEENVVEEPPKKHELEEKKCDLVVLGGGGSGLVAAARAAALSGKKVIVLEKNVNPGGGAWFAADFKVYNSKWQKERGIPDILDKSVKENMDATFWRLSPKLAANCYKATGEFFDWLCESGDHVEDEFKEGFYVFDGPDGPKIPVFKKMRNGEQGGTGKYVMQHMIELCKQYGVEVLTSHEASKLCVENGKITAVIADNPGGQVKIHCKACILATGSWIQNKEILKQVSPDFAKLNLPPNSHNNPLYTGDGIKLAKDAGALIDYKSFCIRLMGPLASVCMGTHHPTLMSVTHEPSIIMVNKNGDRWIDETAVGRLGFFETSHVMVKQPEGISYIIYDTNCLEKAVEAFRKKETVHEENVFLFSSYPDDWKKDMADALAEHPKGLEGADTIEELAHKIGIDPKKLADTIAHYNQLCENKRDTDYYKDKEGLVPMIKGPFYAMSCEVGTDGAFGGVLVNENTQAVAENGTVMEGFYVVGDFSSGRFVNMAGRKVQIINDLAWAFASGFMAGSHAAEYLMEK